MKLKDTTYDALKWCAIYFIPALTTFIGVCGIALDWQYTAVATTICGAAGGFLASCIGMSAAEYKRAIQENYDGTDD